MFKFVFWFGLIGVGVFVGGQVGPAYYNNMKIDNIFEGVATNLVSLTEPDVRSRLNKLLKVQGVDIKDLPHAFSDNLEIIKEDGKLKISSEYHLIIWLLGEPVNMDLEQDYKESEIEPMNKLRLKARIDLDFYPSQETP